MANPHAKTITWEDDRCPDCDQFAPCDCTCDYCADRQRENEALRRRWRKEGDAKVRDKMCRRGANMAEAEAFKARTGAYPYIVAATGSSPARLGLRPHGQARP